MPITVDGPGSDMRTEKTPPTDALAVQQEDESTYVAESPTHAATHTESTTIASSKRPWSEEEDRVNSVDEGTLSSRRSPAMLLSNAAASGCASAALGSAFNTSGRSNPDGDSDDDDKEDDEIGEQDEELLHSSDDDERGTSAMAEELLDGEETASKGVVPKVFGCDDATGGGARGRRSRSQPLRAGARCAFNRASCYEDDPEAGKRWCGRHW